MAKKMNSNDPVRVDVSSHIAGARHIADVTEKWLGKAPGALQEGLTSQQLPEVEIETLVDRSVTVLGFQMRSGKIKGKETEYLIALVVPEGETAVYTLVTGASVIVRKLKQAADAEALPVVGTIVQRKGDFTYYDFIA